MSRSPWEAAIRSLIYVFEPFKKLTYAASKCAIGYDRFEIMTSEFSEILSTME